MVTNDELEDEPGPVAVRRPVYDAAVKGKARFTLPPDLARSGVDPAQLEMSRAELRFGLSDPRGLGANPRVVVSGQGLRMLPGGGSSGGANGFPFDIGYDGEYQQIYAASAFPGPVVISQIAFTSISLSFNTARMVSTSPPGSTTTPSFVSLSKRTVQFCWKAVTGMIPA